jgi:hypothetical protein
MVATSCAAKPWRGIVPLKSNRTNVERLLGPSNDSEFATYYLANETVYVWYSNHGCDEEDVDKEAWDVAPGTVTGISVVPKKKMRLAELGINMRKFKKERGAKDMVGHFFYVNERDGFGIEVVQGLVYRFIYEPRKRDRHLLCRNRTNKRSH